MSKMLNIMITPTSLWVGVKIKFPPEMGTRTQNCCRSIDPKQLSPTLVHKVLPHTQESCLRRNQNFVDIGATLDNVNKVQPQWPVQKQQQMSKKYLNSKYTNSGSCVLMILIFMTRTIAQNDGKNTKLFLV